MAKIPDSRNLVNLHLPSLSSTPSSSMHTPTVELSTTEGLNGDVRTHVPNTDLESMGITDSMGKHRPMRYHAGSNEGDGEIQVLYKDKPSEKAFFVATINVDKNFPSSDSLEKITTIDLYSVQCSASMRQKKGFQSFTINSDNSPVTNMTSQCFQKGKKKDTTMTIDTIDDKAVAINLTGFHTVTDRAITELQTKGNCEFSFRPNVLTKNLDKKLLRLGLTVDGGVVLIGPCLYIRSDHPGMYKASTAAKKRKEQPDNRASDDTLDRPNCSTNSDPGLFDLDDVLNDLQKENLQKLQRENEKLKSENEKLKLNKDRKEGRRALASAGWANYKTKQKAKAAAGSGAGNRDRSAAGDSDSLDSSAHSDAELIALLDTELLRDLL